MPTQLHVMFCFSNTEACYKSKHALKKKKKPFYVTSLFCLLTGASHEWGVSLESFCSSIHKHQFHYEPVRLAWDREDEKDEMKGEEMLWWQILCLCWCASVWIFSPPLSVSVSRHSIFSLPALWTGGCLRFQYPVRAYYSHCEGRKEQMRDGKTNGETERDLKADEWGEERTIGHCAAKYTIMQFSKKRLKID